MDWLFHSSWALLPCSFLFRGRRGHSQACVPDTRTVCCSQKAGVGLVRVSLPGAGPVKTLTNSQCYPYNVLLPKSLGHTA